MKLAIVKYNAGNVQSVEFALNRLGINPIVTDDVQELQTADKVIFPGVGEASSAMDYLRQRGLGKSQTESHLGHFPYAHSRYFLNIHPAYPLPL